MIQWNELNYNNNTNKQSPKKNDLCLIFHCKSFNQLTRVIWEIIQMLRMVFFYSLISAMVCLVDYYLYLYGLMSWTDPFNANVLLNVDKFAYPPNSFSSTISHLLHNSFGRLNFCLQNLHINEEMTWKPFNKLWFTQNGEKY